MVATAISFAAGPADSHGTFHERIAESTLRIEAEPDEAQHYLDRSGIYRNHGDWSEALADLERAAERDPSRADLDFYRGRVYLEAGRAGEAEVILSGFLAARPDHPAARVARARARGALDRHLDAARDWTVAIEHEPVPIPDHYAERARQLAAAGDEHLAAAIAGLDEGLARLGPLVTLLLLSIEIERERGRFDAALERLDEIASQSQRQESWWLRRGEILEQAGRSAAARDVYRRALEEHSKLPAQRRNTPAMAALEEQARKALARLAPRLAP